MLNCIGPPSIPRPDSDLSFYVGLIRERLNRLARLWQKPLAKAGLNYIGVPAVVAGTAAHLAHGAQSNHTNASSGQLQSRGGDFDELISSDDEDEDEDEELSEGDPALLAELDHLYDEFED